MLVFLSSGPVTMPASRNPPSNAYKKNAIIQHKKIAASLVVISVTSLSMFYKKVTIPRPMHISILMGEAWIQELLTGHLEGFTIRWE
jgi:hypothetical protein